MAFSINSGAGAPKPIEPEEKGKFDPLEICWSTEDFRSRVITFTENPDHSIGMVWNALWTRTKCHPLAYDRLAVEKGKTNRTDYEFCIQYYSMDLVGVTRMLNEIAKKEMSVGTDQGKLEDQLQLVGEQRRH